MWDELRRAALVTSGMAELTRNRAEQIVKDLVKAGDLGKDQTSGAVKELLRRSAENRRELARLIRAELQTQIENLGLATRRDLDRLERRVTRLEERVKAATPKQTKKRSSGASSRKTTVRRSPSPGTTKKEASDEG